MSTHILGLIPAIVIRSTDKDIIITVGDHVLLTTDGIEHDKTHKGKVTFINEDCIIIDEGRMIYWEYVLKITKLL